MSEEDVRWTLHTIDDRTHVYRESEWRRNSAGTGVISFTNRATGRRDRFFVAGLIQEIREVIR